MRGGRGLRQLVSMRATAVVALAIPVAAQQAHEPSGRKPVLWWNDAHVVEVLGLDAEARRAMDASYRVHALERPSKVMRVSRSGFKQALMTGDFERAREELQGIVAPTLREGTLKIEVLERLSPEQHQILLQRFPTVFRRKWKPSMGWRDEGPQQASPAPETADPAVERASEPAAE